MQSFCVPSGVRGEVSRQSDRRHWKPFTTTRRNEFPEPISRTRTTVTFRQGRWLLRVKIHDVLIFNGYRWVAMK